MEIQPAKEKIKKSNSRNALQIPKISIDNVSIADSIYDELNFHH